MNGIFNEDVLTGLDALHPKSIHCCVTSPPYYGLRDYKLPPTKWPSVTFSLFGMPVTIPEQECCLGLEKIPMDFVGHIVLIFRKVKNVLRDDGTLWLNFGDSYANYYGDKYGKAQSFSDSGENIGNAPPSKNSFDFKNSYFKPKDLLGIPWMVAFALRDDGWYLRSDIIWHKVNPMPESVTDRPTKSHEYIFLLSKSAKYYYDAQAIATPLKNESIARLAQDIENQKGSDRVPGKTNGTMKAVTGHKFGTGKYDLTDPQHKTKSGKEWIPQMAGGGSKIGAHNGYFDKNGELICGAYANKKTVWTVSTKPFKEAHFATFPPELIVDMIKAGCPINGIILDTFMGSGTTAIVARKLNRNYIGFELSEPYLKIALKRINSELGMFA